MIGNVGCVEAGEAVSLGFPIEVASVDDDSAHRRAVASDKLRCRVDHDVGAMFYGANEVGRAKGVVDNQGQSVTVGNGCRSLDVGDVGMRISQRLDENKFGIGLDCGFQCVVIVRIDERCADPLALQRVCKEIVSAAIDVFAGHDVVACVGDIGDGVRHCGGSRSHGQRAHSALERSHTLFEDGLRRVGEPPVDISGVLQCKAVGGVLRVVENIRGGLVDWNGARIGCRVCLFLPYMKLKCLEV